MYNYGNYIGTLIKQLRKEKNIKAEELAYQVGCDITTLSRIENNKSEPSPRVFEAIMTMFGLDPNKNYDIWVMSKDYRTYRNIRQLKDLLLQRQFEEAEELINSLENEKTFSDGVNLQFLLMSKITVLSSRREEPKVIIDMIYKALHITKDVFSEKYIDQYYFSFDEIMLVNNLAVQYSRLDNYQQAIDILYRLKNSMDKSFIDEEEKARTYPMIIFNLTKCLLSTGQHENIPELCLAARDLCIKQNKLYGLPDLLVNYACSLFHLGDKYGCQKSFYQAYVLLQATDRHKEALQVNEYIKDKLGIALDQNKLT